MSRQLSPPCLGGPRRLTISLLGLGRHSRLTLNVRLIRTRPGESRNQDQSPAQPARLEPFMCPGRVLERIGIRDTQRQLPSRGQRRKRRQGRPVGPIMTGSTRMPRSRSGPGSTNEANAPRRAPRPEPGIPVRPRRRPRRPRRAPGRGLPPPGRPSVGRSPRRPARERVSRRHLPPQRPTRAPHGREFDPEPA